MDTRRLQQIDALRGLAAMSVMLYHYISGFPRMHVKVGEPFASLLMGYLGVQLFFMVSGFVILMTLERTTRASDFLVSRFSRLYPTYWCAVLLTTAGVALMGPARLLRSWDEVLLNLTMVQRPFHGPDVDGVYWTLAVELKFYALALLVYLCRSLGRVRVLLLLGLLLRLLDGPELLPLPPPLSNLLVLKFVPWFACGIAVHGLALRRDSQRSDLVLILMATLVLSVRDSARLAVFAPFASALLYAAARGLLTWLDSRPLQWLGQISYPLYLVHQALGYALILQLKAAGMEVYVAMFVVVALMLAAASALHLAVERPAMIAIRGAWKKRKARTLIAAAQPAD